MVKKNYVASIQCAFGWSTEVINIVIISFRAPYIHTYSMQRCSL